MRYVLFNADGTEACQQGADKLRRIFTREQIEQLRDALQDY